ncbi:hypothetical protein SIN07_08805 [Pediococcus inopinatus]|uniref:DUF2283 domain-containing protein n=1 Tax=Pediococcus inopinatus TaxID=114090 RepID=A0ABZ0Q730_9LACO|nr:hypothetical protein [Pediococcus inopinatus]AVK99230.1 hypothetical protein PI20285_00395 [Pediococcus inopinatus]KRN61308.1 hypothetical protein IV83_GL000933 [Pediococcus inopinatus]WPC20268.1 hypothetical protein N6G95_03535 [Pediococcus inopinatus]WPC21973.1 hypothetical protein N6G96_01795 [Pediococcus inopinatus]WPP09097.1 hypothetical protein SIN07_08805 [Pediococcus inopinatus]
MTQFEFKLSYENGRVVTFYRDYEGLEDAEKDLLAHMSSGSTIKFSEKGLVGMLSFRGAISYLITEKNRPNGVEAITWE